MIGLPLDFSVIEATGIEGVRDVLSNPRHITGYVNVRGVGMVPYEGPLERDFLEIKDFYGTAAYLGSQPVRLQFRDGPHRQYTPDFLQRFIPAPSGATPTPILWEVKPEAELRERWQELRPGFLRAAALCRDRNWRFRLATENHIRTGYLQNIKFLRQYRAFVDDNCLGLVMYERIKTMGVTTPSKLLATCFSPLDTRMEAVRFLWMLVGSRHIATDLSRPLTMESPIWWKHHAGP